MYKWPGVNWKNCRKLQRGARTGNKSKTILRSENSVDKLFHPLSHDFTRFGRFSGFTLGEAAPLSSSVSLYAKDSNQIIAICAFFSRIADLKALFTILRRVEISNVLLVVDIAGPGFKILVLFNYFSFSVGLPYLET